MDNTDISDDGAAKWSWTARSRYCTHCRLGHDSREYTMFWAIGTKDLHLALIEISSRGTREVTSNSLLSCFRDTVLYCTNLADSLSICWPPDCYDCIVTRLHRRNQCLNACFSTCALSSNYSPLCHLWTMPVLLCYACSNSGCAPTLSIFKASCPALLGHWCIQIVLYWRIVSINSLRVQLTSFKDGVASGNNILPTLLESKEVSLTVKFVGLR